MNFQGISSMKSCLALAATAIVLAGCSGGGATGCGTGVTPIGGAASGSSGGSCGNGTTGTPTAADLIVNVTTSSASGIKDTGSDTALVTVTAVDANRNVVASVPVTIAPDSTAVVTTSGTTTASNGTVTGTIGLGSDHSNRMIAVSIVSGSITKTVNIPVTGAVLTATAPAQVSPGSTSTINYHLVDANGNGMSGIQVAISGAFTATGTTDVNGNFSYSFTAPTGAQSLQFNASAAGVSRTDTVVDSTTTVPSAVGTVVAESLAANPSTVGINASGSTLNQVDVRALFLTDHNQPIQNVRVRFDLNGDPNGIGGTLTSGPDVIVYSDANGVARTTYIPGSRASGNQGVTIRGCWSNDDFPQVASGAACPNGQQVTASITVADQGVSLSITTDGLLSIATDDTTIYQQKFSVQVVDSVGNPKAGVKVSGAVDLPRYYLGELGHGNAGWGFITGTNGSTILPQQCDNEDINRNGNRDVFSTTDPTQREDENGNGKLDPAAADVVIAPTSAGSDVTNSFGRASFVMQYGRNKALWDDYTLTFTATVAGSEGSASTSGTLPALASDISSDATPAFAISPYGTNVMRDKDNAGNIIAVRRGTVTTVTVTDPSTGKSANLCGVPQ